MQDTGFDLKLKNDVEVMAAVLEFFHDQKGGWRLLPKLQREDTQTSLAKFILDDNGSKASIIFRPSPLGGSSMTINTNESDLWAMQLGVPGRCELGISTYLGAENSPRCEAFCEDFVNYLIESEYVADTDISREVRQEKPGRPSYPEDAQAVERIRRGEDEDIVFGEWVVSQGVANRRLNDPRDSFRKNVLRKARN